MTAIDWYKAVLQKYVDFTGRARRSEYWYFALVNFGIVLVLTIVDSILGLNRDGRAGILNPLYSLAVFLPALAVGVRRLHDTGKSGWWTLIALVPIVGAIVLIYFYAQEGETGTNKWGANPKS